MDSPEEYHVGVGLSLLSAAVTNRGGFPGGHNVNPPVIWAILVGRSGHTRKTTSIEIGMDVLQRTSGNERLLTSLGSPEGLISQIIRMPTSIVVLKEMGSFLRQASRTYSIALKPTMMELHDAPPKYTRRLSRRTLEVEQPRLCLLGGVAAPFLAHHTTEDDWTGGFFSRCILISATKWRHAKKGLPDSDQRQWLTEVLETYCTSPIPACGGFSPEAEYLFDLWDWENQQTSAAQDDDSIMQAFYSRLDGTCRKVAYLYALDIGDATPGEGWLVSGEATQRAINFCKWIWVRSFNDLAASVALRGDGELLARVEQTILNAGHDGCTHGYLVRSARRLKRRLEEAIMTLKEGERIVQGSMSDGTATYTHTNFSGVTGAAPTAEDMA